MEKAILIFLISCFCCVISEFSGVMQWLKWKTGMESLKPFDCAKCLSFWMCLATFLFMGEGLAIMYASVCMVTSIYIVRYAK